MTDVEQIARDFVSGALSSRAVYERLSSRRESIADELEGDLWALVFEIDAGEITEQAARDWLAASHPPP